jgi:hypothetical protein
MLPERETKEFFEYLNGVAREHKPIRHKFYDKTVDYMEKMGIHVTGDDPKKLLDVKRPNESNEAKKYRLESYKPKTKAAANRVISVINRIYNERLFSIEYKDEPSNISKENGLKAYLTENLPYYVSFMNYIKSVFTKMHMKDANGLLVVLPTYKKEDVEYLEPVPIFFPSDQLVDFEDDEYYIILNTKKNEFRKEQKLMILDKNSIEVYYREHISDKFEFIEEKSYVHNFGFPCAFRVGGVVSKAEPPQLYESFIAGVCPHWDDAVSMYSDLQAVITNHIYPESYVWAVECDDCSGDGTVKGELANGENCDIPCRTCGGYWQNSTQRPI